MKASTASELNPHSRAITCCNPNVFSLPSLHVEKIKRGLLSARPEEQLSEGLHSSLPVSCIAHVSLQKAAALTPQLVAAFIATSDASEMDSLKPDLRNAERPFLFCRISDFSVVAKQYQ